MKKPLPEIEPELSKLPDDLTGKILSYLDSASLLRQRCLNRSFRRMASDSSLWEALCRTLWKSKVHVSRQARNLVSSNGLAAYRIAMEDAKNRDYITQEEICYDPVSQRGTIWSIRFKEAAGMTCMVVPS
jgi:F-box-like